MGEVWGDGGGGEMGGVGEMGEGVKWERLGRWGRGEVRCMEGVEWGRGGGVK